jgi:hypothetical protein
MIYLFSGFGYQKRFQNQWIDPSRDRHFQVSQNKASDANEYHFIENTNPDAHHRRKSDRRIDRKLI